jgi:hypothetical protein
MKEPACSGLFPGINSKLLLAVVHDCAPPDTRDVSSVAAKDAHVINATHAIKTAVAPQIHFFLCLFHRLSIGPLGSVIPAVPFLFPRRISAPHEYLLTASLQTPWTDINIQLDIETTQVVLVFSVQAISTLAGSFLFKPS